MSDARVLCLATAALASASCSACGSSTAAPDVRQPDHPRPRDTRAGDATPDWTPAGCGGRRVLDPRQLVHRAGMPCGRGCEQVSFGFDVMSYEVAGDLLAYSGNDLEGRHAVHVDLAGKQEWLVHKAAREGQGCHTVDTDGERLAYSCYFRPDDAPGYMSPLQVYDPRTRAEEDLLCLAMVSNKSSAPDFIALGASGVAVNLSFIAGPAVDIFFYRFADQTFTNLSQQRGAVWQSRMDGPLVVWTQGFKRVAQTQIVLYDTHDGSSRLLDPSPAGGQWAPRIRGDKVVWVDHRNAPGSMWDPGNSDIYLHDLSTGQTVPVTTHPARQDHPDVSGDWVVWEDYRNNPNPTPKYSNQILNIDIYAKNMKTGEQVHLTSFSGLEDQPRIDRGRVFFRMRTKSNSPPVAVFMLDLEQRLNKR